MIAVIRHKDFSLKESVKATDIVKWNFRKRLARKDMAKDSVFKVVTDIMAGVGMSAALSTQVIEWSKEYIPLLSGLCGVAWFIWRIYDTAWRKPRIRRKIRQYLIDALLVNGYTRDQLNKMPDQVLMYHYEKITGGGEPHVREAKDNDE